MMTQALGHNRSRAAFTLLEMLLTLAMCVVLMGLISGAISFYVRQMSTAEQNYRNSQVASAVLQMIEDDLRMTLTTRPVDTAPLAEILSAASSPLGQLGSSSGGGGGDDEALPEEPEVDESGTGLSEDVAADAEALNVSLGGTVLQSPGLIGSTDQLQIDVSRLPSLEDTAIDPALAVSNGKLLDRPSDIKTISYFVQAAGAGGNTDPLEELAAASGLGDTSSTAAPGASGLVRRELDRAITSHAAMSGGLSRLTSAGEIISPEVSAIQFEYFQDGVWMTYFSTDSVGYLPPAIRVTLQIGGDLAGTSQASENETINTYTHVIYLPMSHPEDAEESTEDAAVGTSVSAASGSSQGGV
ncbi:PulJ/GspJ family protein [Allorhodopirellula solitaria]|uniref:Pseudopilin GspJ n=1 Tax=Allorhodopirellula solitaria TaxID=2527987 RepID=A0A5C5XT04_9BACT|nr:prepilin-type cleavage/methylation domain-containing protein [Allorhodopirellula solitaria]TWT66377.1 hypothetical protein CA85_24710 [Allorhodopirellula solitaria]